MQLRKHPACSFNTKPEIERKIWGDEELLDLVRKYRTQDNLNYNRMSNEPSSGPIIKRFGSWTAAVEASGILRKLGGFDKDKLTTLYLVSFGEFYKIGITTSMKNRFYNFIKNNHGKILWIRKDTLYNCFILEQKILKENTNFLYRPINLNIGGKTECLTKEVIDDF
jgi:hypothetical protein